MTSSTPRFSLEIKRTKEIIKGSSQGHAKCINKNNYFSYFNESLNRMR